MVGFYSQLADYIRDVIQCFGSISPERKRELEKIAEYVKSKIRSGTKANLIFICTHNSRRSQFGQIWAAMAAEFYGLSGNVRAFSGGTEVTAFNYRAVESLKRIGFKIENPGGDNPSYRVYFSEKGSFVECFSKKYNDQPNPRENFAAIMTCSQADENCPYIPGVEMRVSVPYKDPKEADGTRQETARYDERCRQIASEMFYVFSTI